MGENGFQPHKLHGRAPQMTPNPTTPKQGPIELENIAAMSRGSVVLAYTAWNELSDAESLCIDNFLPPNADILDFGCGSGRMATLLEKRMGKYTGVDCAEAMVEAARKRAPNFNFQLGDITQLTFEDECADAILMMNNVLDGLHPIGRRQATLQLAKKMLRPGGVLICSSHLTDRGQKRGYYQEDYWGAKMTNYRSSLTDWVDEIVGAGFEVQIAVRDRRHPTAHCAYIAANRPVAED